MSPRAMTPTTQSAIPHASLRALRGALVRDLGDGFAKVLQESGYAGGESVFGSFRDWCEANGLPAPDTVKFERFKEASRKFFAESGWGTVTIDTLANTVVTVDSVDWAEADPPAGMPYPACYYSAGMLADFFGRVADGALNCMEVECRTAGSTSCRFILGSPEVIGHVYQRLTEGIGYEHALKDLR
jgi:predicted hydrocarbon binding protein